MTPPPLFVGVCMLFWGFLSDHLWAAVPMALAAEAARWLSWRIELDDRDFHRIADASSIAFVLLAFYQFNARSIHGIYGVLGWLPAVLFPLLLAQRYSTRGRIKLSALVASLRRAPPEQDREVQLDYPYALLALIAASTTEMSGAWYFAGCCVLVAGGLWSCRPRRRPAVAWIAVVTLACGVGFALQTLMVQAQSAVERAVLELLGDRYWADTNPDWSMTAIGTIGRMKFSDRIVLRVRAHGPVSTPILLREAAYNVYTYGMWRVDSRNFTAIDPDTTGHRWILAAADPRPMRASITTRLKEESGVIPLPMGLRTLSSDEILAVQNNTMGAVLADAKPGYLTYDVDYAGDVNSASAPTAADRDVPAVYAGAFGGVANELGLEGQPPEQVVAAVRRFFAENFRYSLYQRQRAPWRKPLVEFLLRDRQGHCEYFAAATVLLLRAGGVPARYAVGYAISDYSRMEGQYIGRGRDAHAWAEAYVDGAWRVVDTTPSVWAEAEDEAASRWSTITDAWAWLAYRWSEWQPLAGRQHLLLWLIAPLTLVLFWRLRSRRRVARAPAFTQSPDALRAGQDSELYTILKALHSRGLGPDQGETLALWAARLRRLPEYRVLGEGLSRLVTLHYRHRFDPLGLDAEARHALRTGSDGVLREIEALAST